MASNSSSNGIPQSIRWTEVKISLLTYESHFSTLQQLLTTLKSYGATLQPSSKHGLRTPPVDNLLVNINDGRFLSRSRDVRRRRIICIDSNVLMRRFKEGSAEVWPADIKFPAQRLYDAATSLGHLVVISSSILAELKPHYDTGVFAWAQQVSYGQLEGTIDMRRYIAPPLPLSPALKPAIDPFQLRGDSAIRWELLGLLEVLGESHEKLVMVTGDRAMWVILRTARVGSILMANGNSKVDRGFPDPDSTEGWVDFLLKLL